jgi:hypothetical protein
MTGAEPTLATPMGHETSPVDPMAAFKLRAWARARLYAERMLELHDAVDVLQDAAEWDGLIDSIGQDRVQAILAENFGGRE